MTARLLGVLQEKWADFDGYAVSHNMPDLMELPLDRVTNFVWYFLTKDADAEGLDKFKATLWQPPRGVVVTDERSPWHPAQENSAFDALRAELGVS